MLFEFYHLKKSQKTGLSLVLEVVWKWAQEAELLQQESLVPGSYPVWSLLAMTESHDFLAFCGTLIKTRIEVDKTAISWKIW